MTYIAEARPRRTPATRGGQVRRRSETPAGNPALERRLSDARVSRAHRQSRVRTLQNHRNEAVAAALTARVPVAAIAAITGLKLTDVKKIGKGHSDSYVAGVSREQHLAGLAEIAGQLLEAVEEKATAERKFRADVVEALRSGQLDVFRIAALTAVTAERLREITRGTGLRGEAFRSRPS